MMNMRQLEEIIENDLRKIDVSLKDKKIRSVFFLSEPLGFRAPGSYLYIVNDEFHCVSIGDRGAIEAHEVYTNKTECLFRVYWFITTMISIDYASQNRTPGKDWRRIMFQKHLELLKRIGEVYFQKGQIEINKILANAPYSDDHF